MTARTDLGTAGEDAAASFLATRGLTVVERNVRLSGGELDLICRDGSLIVFCEVKTRRTDAFGSPSEAVNAAKRARIRRLAAQWLAARRPGPVDLRFDVVSVIVRDGRELVTHIPDAF